MEGNSDEVRVNLSSSASHHRVQKSTTLNRRYVKKPEVANVAAAESAAIDSVAKRRADARASRPSACAQTSCRHY